MFRSFWSGAAQTNECFEVWPDGMRFQANVSKFFKMFDMFDMSEAGFDECFEDLLARKSFSCIEDVVTHEVERFAELAISLETSSKSENL